MSRDWHEQFKAWAKPPSDTEEQKGSRGADMIRTAVRESEKLKTHNVEVYATGSYANNTNVRLDSDIDVAVVLHDTLFFDLPSGVTTSDVGISTPATYSFETFRDDVEAALRAKFDAGVKPDDRTFTIRANTYRLSADATVFCEYRRYTGKSATGTWIFDVGTEMRPRRSPSMRIQNWHRQHYEAGVAKNDATGRRYKRVVRILKNLRAEMAEAGTGQGKAAAAEVPSFLIECIVFNAPDGKFGLVEGSYYEDVRAVIAWLFNKVKADAPDPKFVEVSGLKALFQDGQAWTRVQAAEFLLQAWKHVGFRNA